ncbi:hypothetical protein BGZ99_001945 [Dissophora globulifera]|uniref:Uncharacterized protein n=1 Tax=Dissophora globulifera TaxID=979702 RepID=A0A9P6R1E1_9FUNG|nr:hypothetical protein BGZ99_001945 [Dissophora globulifera]
MQTQLKVYEQVVADLDDIEKRKKAQRAATAVSAEVTDAVATMVSGSVKHMTVSHLDSLKRANMSSDDDFENPPSVSKKNKQELQPAIDPWANLEKASISLHNGERGVRLPKVPANLPSNHLLLFKIAHQCLTAANGPLKKVTDAVNLKDALVAMSCILNLRSPTATTHFPASFVAKATDGCYEDGYDRNELVSRCFAGMTDIFKAEGVLGLRYAAEDKKAVYRKERQAGGSLVRSQEEKLMDIIEIACDLVSEKQFEEPHAEADTLHIWLKILEKLLPIRLRMKTGESVLTCSKPGLQQKDDDMMGRKVDLKFTVDGIEVAVIEFKSASQAKGAVTKQSRKSLRLGKSIQQSLETLGVEDAYVVCGDVAGK